MVITRFSWCHKILIKFAFRKLFGNFYYKMMPFELKNASATYQRTMTLTFGDMLHKQVKDYVNDLVVRQRA